MPYIEKPPIPPALEAEVLRLRSVEKKSQPAIIAWLAASGYVVSQATLSRFLASRLPAPSAGLAESKAPEVAAPPRSLATAPPALRDRPSEPSSPGDFDAEPFGGDFEEGEDPPREPARAAPPADRPALPPPPADDLSDDASIDLRLRQIRRLMTDELFLNERSDWIRLVEIERKWLDLRISNSKGKNDGSRTLESFTADCFRADPPPPLE